ncbi:MAG: type IV toxin-antitoxin system AbiEi family antitoxin domain-containing protein [Henriciella sp.]|nr:type IV toxin-antitoxin system AbiEi family antitoxin domain-containing protein [Henriciella sp.]
MLESFKTELLAEIERFEPNRVWTAADFAHLGHRDAIDKALQRLVASGDLKRVARGLYQKLTLNGITNRPNPTTYTDVLEALERRDGTPMLIDGMTAANDLGLTTAVPAKIIVHTSSRRSELDIEGQKIIFRNTAPSKLRWAGRPAMRLVQALQWVYDHQTELDDDIVHRVRTAFGVFLDVEDVKEDLIKGFSALPSAWMQDLLRPILFETKSI